jgi:hypothetical protein
MIKIPTLPFACSIVGGGLHAGVHVDNDAVFNGEYFAGLHEVHGKDIPHLLTEKLADELLHYVSRAHKDLVCVMFGRLLKDDVQGVVCVPVRQKDKKRLVYVTVAYRFCQDEDALEMTISVMGNNGKGYRDFPTLAFKAERMGDGFELGIDIPEDVTIPMMFRRGDSLGQLESAALYWVKFVCVFESMFLYKIVSFNGYFYDAMLSKKGACVNPNGVCVNLLTAYGEQKGIP